MNLIKNENDKCLVISVMPRAEPELGFKGSSLQSSLSGEPTKGKQPS